MDFIYSITLIINLLTKTIRRHSILLSLDDMGKNYTLSTVCLSKKVYHKGYKMHKIYITPFDTIVLVISISFYNRKFYRQKTCPQNHVRSIRSWLYNKTSLLFWSKNTSYFNTPLWKRKKFPFASKDGYPWKHGSGRISSDFYAVYWLFSKN